MNPSILPKHLWRNDITGLRAIAVIPVLLFHAFPNIIPGGFFGVDVFFVISGYLISGIIFRNLINNSFSYKDFYSKRIKRIIPNLLLLLAFVTAIGFFTLLPNEYANLGKHVYSSSAFIENFRLLKEVDYFTEDALRKPLLHLWSLAIEEQFYIAFPIVCAIIWKTSANKKAIGATVLLIFIASIAWCFLTRDNSFRFYFPLTRFWEIGAGILLSYSEYFLGYQSKKVPIHLRHALSFLGISAILIPMIAYSPNFSHPGPITILPVLGSVSLIAAHTDAFINRTILSWKIFTFIGLISYSLYLWHWPILSYIFICIGNASTLIKATALLISFPIASIVYFYIENPIRRKKSNTKIPISVALMICLIIAIAIGQTLRLTGGVPSRPFNKAFHEIANIRKVGEWDAFSSAEKIKAYGTNMSLTSKQSYPSTIFIGDSHIAQYFNKAKQLSISKNIAIGFIASPGCLIFNGDTPFDKAKCEQTSKAFYDVLSDKRIHTLVIAQKWGWKPYLENKSIEHVFDRFNSIVSKRPDLKIYVLLDYPWSSDYDPLRYFNRLSYNPDDFIQPFPKENDWSIGNTFVQERLSKNVTFIDPTPIMCPNQQCNLLKWYRDTNHLQPISLEKNGIWLDPIFQNIGTESQIEEK